MTVRSPSAVRYSGPIAFLGVPTDAGDRTIVGLEIGRLPVPVVSLPADRSRSGHAGSSVVGALTAVRFLLDDLPTRGVIEADVELELDGSGLADELTGGVDLADVEMVTIGNGTALMTGRLAGFTIYNIAARPPDAPPAAPSWAAVVLRRQD